MTRLLLKLRAANNAKFEQEHHRQVQGLIFDLLRESNYSKLHDKKGSKFFAYSNIFPFFDLHGGDIRNLIISSPSRGFISHLKDQLDYLREIEVGCMKFKIDYCRKFDIILSQYDSFSFITGTPILVRNYRSVYDEGKTKTNDKNREICWTSNYPVDLFLKQLEHNLIKKYNEFYGFEAQTTKEKYGTIFYKPRLLKEVATRIFMSKTDKSRTVVIGTNWKFSFDECNPLLQFALDCGLGERNSMGFGFMNLLDGKGRLALVN